MSLIEYGAVTGPVLRGHSDDKINLHDGMMLNERVGYAKITNLLQTNIPIFLPGSTESAEARSIHPDKRLVLPVGAIVTSIALRLPRLETNVSTPQYGNLDIGATLIGITGEFVKVAADGVFTTTAPSIVSVANLYTPNLAAAVNRNPAAPADVATSSLITVTAATSMSLVVSNAGNTAAGAGIRTSSGDAYAIVRINYLEPLPAPTYEDMGFLARTR
jgi:hypothetical protein